MPGRGSLKEAEAYGNAAHRRKHPCRGRRTHKRRGYPGPPPWVLRTRALQSWCMLRRLLLLLICSAALFAQKRPFDVNAMMELKRISDPQLSPDGKWVTFGVQTVDVAGNKKPQQIWIVPLAGGVAHPITHDGEANQRARWSPDSKRIAYISDRGGAAQIWLMDPDGSDA